MTISELQNIDFHDQSLGGLTIDFLNSKLVFQISIYNEVKSDYDDMSLIFENVSDFQMTELIIHNLTDFTIGSLSTEKKQEDHFCKLLLISNVDSEVVEIQFSFKGISKY